MKRKTYRAFIDVVSETGDREAVERYVHEEVISPAFEDQVRIQESPFDDEEEGIILKLARLALADAETFDNFKDYGMSDKELKNLQKKIEGVTNR